jgi:hypothetical protein
VPIVVVAWGSWRRATAAGALAFVGFAAASPFALVHIGEVLADLDGLQRRARAGWLGFEHDHATPIAFVDRLWESLGPVLLIGAIGLVVALAVRAPADRALAAFALAYYAVLLPLDAHFDRYVLPLVPVLAALAGRFRSLAPVTLLVLVVPLTWSIREDRELVKTDVRIVAHQRLASLMREARVAVDPSLPHPPRVVELTLPAPWSDPDPNRDVLLLAGHGVDYVAVTGAIADRVLAARDEYPLEARFYEELERQATRVWRIDPGPDLAGPWVALYRLPGS